VARPVAPLRGGWGILAPAILAGALLILTGCATKRDLRDLRAEVIALQVRQDSMLRELQRVQRVLVDSARANSELLLRVRGDLAHQLLELQQQVAQVQELTGQGQRGLQDLWRRLEARGAELGPDTLGASLVPPQPSGSAAELYAAGVQQLERGAAATARMAFEQILRMDPLPPEAPDAQYKIAETYILENKTAEALAQLENVVKLFPNSPQAPEALYRAGVLSEEQGNIQEARRYFQRVQTGFPGSDAARQAAEKLRRLRR